MVGRGGGVVVLQIKTVASSPPSHPQEDREPANSSPGLSFGVQEGGEHGEG